MFLTLWCVVVVLGSILLVGLPLSWLLNGRRPLGKTEVLLVPFLGIAGIILPLQNLVYCDVPIARSAPFFWGTVLLAWLWFLKSGHAGPSLRQVLGWPLAACLVVFGIQGLALLDRGAESYLGRAWTDSYNYTVMAQFMADVPFSTPLEAVGNQPYLFTGVAFKSERLGQSILQGFFAVSSGQDAKTLFGPTILLSPTLIALVIFLFGRRLGLPRWQALAAGMAAGLLPGLTGLHLECFLSHALAVPFLLLAPVALYEFNKHGDGRTLVRTALLIA